MLGQLTHWYCRRNVVATNDCSDLVTFYDYGSIGAKGFTVEDTAGGNGVLICAHRVRVTFSRWRG